MATTKRLVKGSALTAAEHDANVTEIDNNSAKNSYPSADSTKLAGIETGAEVNTINSTTSGEPTGSDQVLNVVSLTQAEYDAGTPVAGTYYVITDDTNAYGSFYITTSLTNTANGTPAKLVGSGVTAANLNSDFTHTTPNKLAYTGTVTKVFKVSASLTCTHSVNNAIMTFSLAKNGSNITNTNIQRKVGTGGDIGAFALEWLISLAENDYVELYCDASSAGTSTVSLGVVNITEV